MQDPQFTKVTSSRPGGCEMLQWLFPQSCNHRFKERARLLRGNGDAPLRARGGRRRDGVSARERGGGCRRVKAAARQFWALGNSLYGKKPARWTRLYQK